MLGTGGVWRPIAEGVPFLWRHPLLPPVAVVVSVMVVSSLWLPVWNAVVTTLGLIGKKRRIRRYPGAVPGIGGGPSDSPEV